MSKFVIKDTFFYKAKQDGFRARSAYKLKEIQDKFGLVRKDDRVLDLGCAPGSFLQVLSKLTGDRGKVIGVDILSTPPLPAANVTVMKLDIRDMNIRDILEGHSLDRFDLITCDIAPNLSGIREADDRNVNELFETVLNIVREGLRTGGNFLVKSFFSDSFKETDAALKGIFRKVSVFKPSASRRVSSEVYFVCFGKK
jgi:23S rRNA (uridine2552-2'-O)-methyltransferase